MGQKSLLIFQALLLLLHVTAWEIPKSGCQNGFCFSKCGPFGITKAWCYTTKETSMDGNYVACDYDSDCEYHWSCAGACYDNPYSHTKHFSQPKKKVGAPGDKLTLLSWNVYGMVFTSLQKERATEIGNRLKRADIVLLQEAWCANVIGLKRWDHFSKYLYDAAKTQGFNEVWNINASAESVIPKLDSGLGILSKYPIEHDEFDRYEFSKGTESDDKAKKGIAYAKIKVNESYQVHVFTTHTQAHYTEEPSKTVKEVQDQQMSEVIGFMKLMSDRHGFHLKNDHVVLAGDFNTNIKNIWEIYDQTQKEALVPIWDSRKMEKPTSRSECPKTEFTSLYVWERENDELKGGFSPLQPGSQSNLDVFEQFGACLNKEWWAKDAEITRNAANCPKEHVDICPCCSCTEEYCLEYATWDLQFYSESLNEIIETKRVGKDFSQWNHGVYRSLSDHWPTVSTWMIPEPKLTKRNVKNSKIQHEIV